MGAPFGVGGTARSHGRANRTRYGLLRFRALVARPRAGQPRDAVAGAVVGEAADEPEDGALDHQCGEQLHEAAGLAVLRMGGLILVDQAPDLLEDLAPDDAGDEAE